MKVEIWSDVVCPWCYVGKRRFEVALAGFEHRDAVEVRWRSFELDPGAPRERAESPVGHLAAKYGVSRADAEAMLERMTTVAAGEGLQFRFDRFRPGNTFDAHRLLHLAAERGCQDALIERLMAAAFTEGQPVGDVDTLAGLAGDAGLDDSEARRTLIGDAHADAVRADEGTARRLGISSVPFFVIQRTYGVAGAHPADVLRDALSRAWSHLAAPAMAGTGDGAGADRPDRPEAR